MNECAFVAFMLVTFLWELIACLTIVLIYNLRKPEYQNLIALEDV